MTFKVNPLRLYFSIILEQSVKLNGMMFDKLFKLPGRSTHVKLYPVSFLLVDYPMHIDTISMDLSILHFKGSQVESPF